MTGRCAGFVKPMVILCVCACLFVFFVQGKNSFTCVRFIQVLPMLPSLVVMTAQKTIELTVFQDS